jgi:hypothetical protein
VSGLRARALPALGLLLVVGAGLAIRYLGLPPFVAKYGGVALWATAAYAGVLVVRPGTSVRGASLCALGLSLAVELAQLTDGPAWLSSRHLLLRLIFGTTFSAWDLCAYPVGVALGALLHRALLLRREGIARSSVLAPQTALREDRISAFPQRPLGREDRK